jgi:hypothetical protein
MSQMIVLLVKKKKQQSEKQKQTNSLVGCCSGQGEVQKFPTSGCKMLKEPRPRPSWWCNPSTWEWEAGGSQV